MKIQSRPSELESVETSAVELAERLIIDGKAWTLADEIEWNKSWVDQFETKEN